MAKILPGAVVEVRAGPEVFILEVDDGECLCMC